MKIQIKNLVEWFKAHDFRDQAILVLMSLAAIYTIFDSLLIRPLEAKNKDLKTQIQSITAKSDTILAQISMVDYIIKEKNDRTGNDYSNYFYSTSDISSLIKDIVNLKSADILLMNLKNLKDEPFNMARSDKMPFSITQHGLQLNFVSGYFQTINYLTRLEKLPWHFYWDNLSYKVVKYPQAEVIIKFHVLSKEKSAS